MTYEEFLLGAVLVLLCLLGDAHLKKKYDEQ